MVNAKNDLQTTEKEENKKCLLQPVLSLVDIMAIPVIDFKSCDTKLERVWPKNQHTQRKFLNHQIC